MFTAVELMPHHSILGRFSGSTSHSHRRPTPSAIRLLVRILGEKLVAFPSPTLDWSRQQKVQLQCSTDIPLLQAKPSASCNLDSLAGFPSYDGLLTAEPRNA